SGSLSEHIEAKVAAEENEIIDFSALDKLDQVSGEKTANRTHLVGDGNYYALLIGINNYLFMEKLKTPIHDVQVLAQTLKRYYGFTTRLLQDPTRAEILTAFNNYRNILKPQDNFLIYYAGHGWLDTAADEGYWFPVDATQKNEINWISNSSITSTIRAMKAKHIMVVADSCYSGKLTRGLDISRNTPDYYSQMVHKKARVVLSSGGVEPVADRGGRGGHSVFSSAFLKALLENKGIMEGTELFNKIRRSVVLNTDQTPEYADIRKAGHEGGDFLFIRRKN
ncbi:MAG: caspase family protein, partial [Thermodesulfobacteriota bacterium]|nr:caspase family protein [Thermodesulfobacteriota bacterium]